MIWKNNSIYLGHFHSDRIDGYGIMKWQSGNWKGDAYYGEFLLGQKNGWGIYKSANGDVYEGNYKNDKKEGFGIKYFSNGYIYKGTWKDNQKDGKATIISSDGRMQKAIFEQGKRTKVLVGSGTSLTNSATSTNFGSPSNENLQNRPIEPMGSISKVL